MGRDDGRGGHDAESEVEDYSCSIASCGLGRMKLGLFLPATWLRQLLCDDTQTLLDESGLYEGRRIKQHDSVASSGMEDATDAALAKMDEESRQRDAAAATAHSAVEAQRVKVVELAEKVKLAYEDESQRKLLQSRLNGLQSELDRRERVAKQASEAAAYARTQVTMHRNAAAAFAAEQAKIAAQKLKAEEEREAAEKEESQKRREETEAAAAKRAREGTVEDYSPTNSPTKIIASSFNSALLTRWVAAEERWEGFASSSTLGVIGEDDVPWPDMTVVKLMLQNMPEQVDLRTLQARWHPDRFMPKFSPRMKESQRQAISARVTATAAAMNALKQDSAAASASPKSN